MKKIIVLGWPPVMLWLLAGCLASPTPTGLNPTQYFGTRIVWELTRQALTQAAQPSPATAVPSTGASLPSATPAPVVVGSSPVPVVIGASPIVAPASPAPTTHEHFWLLRPVPTDYVNYPDRTYPYGDTMNYQREPHHGVEFVNGAGSPVIAAAAGKVIVAGNDDTQTYGPTPRFYGKLVIVQLDQTYQNQPLFNLYGHLQDIVVQAGQTVGVGDLLGTVGQTGIAIGPHLHFEVRVGQNDYLSTRNPELWFRPLIYNGHPWGVVAGRVVDTAGQLVSGYPVVIRPVNVETADAHTRYVNTYAAETLNGDDYYQENFAANDLPLGTYLVSVNTTTLYQQTVTVTAGQITWVTFTVKPPVLNPTPTSTP